MSDRRQVLGAAGEDAVAAWYAGAGYEILDRNWRGRDGELDLVVGRDHLIVFCEVKTRTSERFGLPAEAVTMMKQHRIRRLAIRWLSERSVRGELRFDVASVRPCPHDAGLDVEVIEDAF